METETMPAMSILGIMWSSIRCFYSSLVAVAFTTSFVTM